MTYVNEDREAAWRTVAPLLQRLPMPPEDLAARCIVGPAAECVEKLHRFVEAGCSKFVLRSALRARGGAIADRTVLHEYPAQFL